MCGRTYMANIGTYLTTKYQFNYTSLTTPIIAVHNKHILYINDRSTFPLVISLYTYITSTLGISRRDTSYSPKQ